MDNSRTVIKTDTSQVYFHNTDPLNSPWPYMVSAGGRTFAAHKDGTVSRRYHDHTLILTLAGQGNIQVGESAFTAMAGDVVWLDTSRRYAHGATSGTAWSYLWFAVSGHGLDRLHTQIGLSEAPVTHAMDHLGRSFETILHGLIQNLPTADALMNAEIASITGALFANRVGDLTELDVDPISKLMRELRQNIDHKWEVSRMARIAGLSQSQLFRRFKEIAGTTPISWLRQERMQFARYMLTATTENIATIALKCGYIDPFHFSRDFKQVNACSPREFRTNTRL